MKKYIRLISLILAFITMFSTICYASVPETYEPDASYYIDGRYASCSAVGGGKIKVYFEVNGTMLLNMIGATTIDVYKSNGTPVASYSYYNYPSMMGYSSYYHTGYVTYQGVSGQSYYAVVNFYARASSGSDSKTSVTNIATA